LNEGRRRKDILFFLGGYFGGTGRANASTQWLKKNKNKILIFFSSSLDNYLQNKLK